MTKNTTKNHSKYVRKRTQKHVIKTTKFGPKNTNILATQK